MLDRGAWGMLTADLDAPSVTLMRLWTLPAEVTFKSVADVALEVAEACAIHMCVQRYAEEDTRYGTVLKRSWASRKPSMCGFGSFFGARSRLFCMAVHMYQAEHGHCNADCRPGRDFRDADAPLDAAR